MSKTPLSTAAAAARLAEALSAHDDLSCAEAEPLIATLLDAEQAGEKVEDNPVYASLLRHMDTCEGCLNLYEQLAVDQEAVVGALEVLPSVTLAPPVFFAAPIPKGEHVLLQVLRGMVRRFTLTFDMPRLAPTLATLSGPQRTLYSDTLSEVAGTPLLALTAGQTPEGLLLQVALREPSQKTPWQIRLEVGDQQLTTTTDARGVARFTLPPRAALGELRLHCEELPVAAQDK